jgi:hypothetical protein
MKVPDLNTIKKAAKGVSVAASAVVAIIEVFTRK